VSQPISTPWFAKMQLNQFSVSPEGSRVAFIATVDGVRNIYLAGIVRDGTGKPTSITQPTKLISSRPWPISIAWCSPLNLLELFRLPGDTESFPVVQTVGGDVLELDSFSSATQIMANPAGGSYFAVTQFGQVLQYRGYNWTPYASGVTVAHMAQ
jgi:hypothetical protein